MQLTLLNVIMLRRKPVLMMKLLRIFNHKLVQVQTKLLLSGDT